MKKIMFNDSYGLTKAVLEGRKTMTRRVVSDKLHQETIDYVVRNARMDWDDEKEDAEADAYIIRNAPYKIGEVVAVAQSYKQMCDELDADFSVAEMYIGTAGWGNKMFVKAEDMLHKIRITNVRVERLQDISYEECLREGIRKVDPLQSLICLNASTYQIDGPGCENTHYTSPRGAFAALIDKVSGKGTWESNPWVFVYEFELVK